MVNPHNVQQNVLSIKSAVTGIHREQFCYISSNVYRQRCFKISLFTHKTNTIKYLRHINKTV